MKEGQEMEMTEPNDDSHGDEEYAGNGNGNEEQLKEKLMLPEGNAKKRTSRAHPASSTSGRTTVTDTTMREKRQRKKDAASTSSKAIVIKYTALLLLVAQMVGLVLIMRYSRTNHDPDQPLYLASTAVFIMEVMKLVVCLVIVAYQANGAIHTELYQHVVQSPMEILKLTVPSILYTIQNNLLYLALTNLDAATYQVCYQLKILTTALFSALLLQRKFSTQKWLALVILTTGVAIVQVSGSGDQHSDHADHPGEPGQVDTQNRVVGLVAVLCAACTSGFSGVYFEKILKGSRTSLWIRNVQMGLPSVLIAFITVYIKDAAAIQQQGFLGGYNNIVWTVVSVQAVGGLIVATVVKYADNVLKVFATSFSIVLSCMISAFLFDFHPSWMFLSGASLVVTATVMYSSPEKKARRKASGPLLPVARSR